MMAKTYVILPESIFLKLMEISDAESPEEAVKKAVEHYLRCINR